MTLDDLIEKLYQIYEENDCNGGIPVTISTYSCGSVSVNPLGQRLQVVKSDTGEVSINIDAEDN